MLPFSVSGGSSVSAGPIPQFCTLRQTLLGQISDVGFDIANMTTKDLCYLLLYGKPNGSTLINRMILEATVSFIKSSKRFE